MTNPERSKKAPLSRPGRDWVVAGIILAHFALALALTFFMLLGYAPDEPRHFAYVRWLAEHHSFPPPDERLSGGAHSLHPPLYYILMLPLYWAFRGWGDLAAMRAMRCVAPLFGVGALWLLVPVIEKATAGRRGMTLFALSLLALWPQLLVCVAMVNNDAAAVLMAAVLLHVVLVRRWDTRPCSAALWGAVLGLGSLAKFSNFVAGAPTILTALALAHGKGFYRREAFWKAGFLAAVCCFAVCGWWWIRNLLVYGAINPYPVVPILPPGLTPLDALITGHAWKLFLRAINGLWASTWPAIDWAPATLMPAILLGLRVLTVLAIVGGLAWIWRLARRRISLTPDQAAAIFAPAAGYAGMFLALLYVATFKHAGTYRNGRYLMPFVVGLVLPIAVALEQVCPRRWRLWAAAALLAFWLFLTAAGCYHLVTYWNPLILGHK